MPSTKNKMMPGIKKLLKGDLSNMHNGIPNNFPLGEMMKITPPPMAPDTRKANKPGRILRGVFGFIILKIRKGFV